MEEQSKEKLLEKIELQKKELDRLTSQTDHLTDEKIVKKSQELDKLLNKYYELIKKKG